MQDVDLGTFDSSRSITLRQAIDANLLSFKGRKPSLALVQRWANPRRGLLPTGPSGRRLVLPTVLTGREKLTMPEWVDWFVAQRSAALVENARRIIAPVARTEAERRGREAMRRMGHAV